MAMKHHVIVALVGLIVVVLFLISDRIQYFRVKSGALFLVPHTSSFREVEARVSCESHAHAARRSLAPSMVSAT